MLISGSVFSFAPNTKHTQGKHTTHTHTHTRPMRVPEREEVGVGVDQVRVPGRAGDVQLGVGLRGLL